MNLPTLRQLEYIVAIAEEGSFHSAAKACHVTQPGLSAQVKQLEQLLEVQIFERDRRQIRVTPGGAELVRRARRVLEEAKHLVESAQLYRAPLSGPLRLGVIPTVSPYLLPRALPDVRARFPELVIQLHEGQTGELLELLARGELDVALLALEAPLPDVATFALFRDPFAVAVPDGHRLARRKSVREPDLAGEPMLLLEDGHCLRSQALAVCARSGVEEASDFRASSLPTLVQMVAGGSGVTLLPELAVPVEGRARGLSILPFRGRAPFRTIGLAWRPSSPRGEEFRLLGKHLRPSATAKR